MSLSFENIIDQLEARVREALIKRHRKYLNVEDVATLYPFPSAGAVRTLASRRKIPHRKVNGRLIFLKSELEEWIESSPGMTVSEYKRKKRYGSDF